MTTTAPEAPAINVSRRAASIGYTVPVHIAAGAYRHVRPRLDEVLFSALFAAAAVREPGDVAEFTHELTRLVVVVGDGPSITIREA